MLSCGIQLTSPHPFIAIYHLAKIYTCYCNDFMLSSILYLGYIQYQPYITISIISFLCIYWFYNWGCKSTDNAQTRDMIYSVINSIILIRFVLQVTPQKTQVYFNSNAKEFQTKRLSVLSKTYLRLNPNALVFSIKRKYVFPLCLKSPNFSLFIQKTYI